MAAIEHLPGPEPENEDQELLLVSRDNFNVSYKQFQGEGAIAFDKLSEESMKKQPSLSMEIEFTEFAQLRTAMQTPEGASYKRYFSWEEDNMDTTQNYLRSHSSDGTIPCKEKSIDITPQMKYTSKIETTYARQYSKGKDKTKMVPVYSWRMLDSKGGVKEKSKSSFLIRENCVREGQQVPKTPGHTMDVYVEKVISGTKEVLLREVYAHLLKLEYRMRIKQWCNGCIENLEGQLAHMDNGCLSPKQDLIDLHAKPSHLRISNQRLFEAAREVKSIFDVYGVRYKDVIACMKDSDPACTLIAEDGITYYEFKEAIDKL